MWRDYNLAHSKLYRNFLILKEDGKGYSVSSDKPLSGYAKIEGKGDKCKITFYAQNLKKDNYHMILMCFKKGMKQNINLGAMNINEQGRAEISKEYSINNIGDTGAQIDNISGAAVVKIVGSSFTVVMCGFMSGEKVPEGWNKMNLIPMQTEEKLPKEMKVEEKPAKEIIREEETPKEVKAEGNMAKEHIREEDAPKEIKAQENLAKEEVRQEETSKEVKVKENIMKENNTEEDTAKELRDEENESEEDRREDNTLKEINTVESIAKDNISEESKITETDDVRAGGGVVIPKEYMPGTNNDNENLKDAMNILERRFAQNDYNKNEENEFDKYEKIIEASKIVLEESKLNQNIMSKAQENNNIKENNKIQENKEEDIILRGSVADFFEAAAEGFEPMRGICKEVKYCKWYKVKVDSLDTLCNISNYNKYTIAYYPMMNYYPYIKKYGYYLLGYKCDPTGQMKYLVYGIPGKKDKIDQPYGGKSGFVTWVPSHEKDEHMGYWLMFFDFKNSVIVVPMK